MELLALLSQGFDEIIPPSKLVMEQLSDDLFHAQISSAFSQWIDAIANVLITAG